MTTTLTIENQTDEAAAFAAAFWRELERRRKPTPILRGWDECLAADAFLKRCIRGGDPELLARLDSWDFSKDAEFANRLEGWFDNFKHDDKPLARKVLLNIDYFTHARYEQTVRMRGDRLHQVLHEIGIADLSRIRLVVSTLVEDSSHVNAYLASKSWGLPLGTARRLDEIADDGSADVPLVLFNDTYGSGQQLTGTLLPKIRNRIGRSPILVVGISIAREALERFKAEIPGVVVIPDEACRSVREEPFTGEELLRLEAIGRSVYPKHPLGFGGTALLVAYFFACPNNTLPIIWADGENNAGGSPWRPLFPYRAKKKAPVGLPKPDGDGGGQAVDAAPAEAKVLD